MALKPTIYKARITLSDIDRDYYDELNLTIAQHPSETRERMMARVLAFCLNARESPVFTKGLCAVDEPDIRVTGPDDRTVLWIDVGEPAVDRIKKAMRHAPRVKVYSFNAKSDVWWHQRRAGFAALPVSIYQFQWQGVQALAGLVQRSMAISMTITGDCAYIAAGAGTCEVSWVPLQCAE